MRSLLKSRLAFMTIISAHNVFGQLAGHSHSLTSPPSLAKRNLADGVQQAWVRNYTATNRYRRALGEALALDPRGNVYVTGRNFNSDDRTDFTTIKYNALGVTQWVRHYNGPANLDDDPVAIAIDDSGNTYVTGQSMARETYWDYLTIKYNSVGTQQWVARYNGPANLDDGALALAVDKSGNVYVSGFSENTSGEIDDSYATIKYTSNGKIAWVARFGDGDSLYNRVVALAFDELNNVYLSGSSYYPGRSSKFTTIKYKVSGEKLWVAEYADNEYPFHFANALALDGVGNIYVAGSSQCCSKIGSLGRGAFTTVKYKSTGSLEWVARYDDRKDNSNYASALTLDRVGNVYVAGISEGNGLMRAAYDFALLKYDTNGVQQWVRKYNGPGKAEDVVAAISVDNLDNVYVTGYSTGVNTGHDYTTIKYNPSGVKQWVARKNGPSNQADRAKALAVDHEGNVYVTGFRSVRFDSTVYTTIKYTQTTVAVEEQNEWPLAYRLDQNYPNPFNPSTTIRYSITKQGRVTLKVFNLSGQELDTLIDESRSAGEYEIQWQPRVIPSGVYFYQLQAGEFVQAKKLILLR